MTSPYLGSVGEPEQRSPVLSWLDRYRPRPLEYQRLWWQRLDRWLIALNVETMANSRWMGVPAAKNPLDAWIYQEIVYETGPEVIVELGSAYGGGALYLAHLLDLLGGRRTVVTVDIDRDVFRARHPGILPITGSTSDPEVIRQVSDICSGRRTMVLHDASHRAAQVLVDLRAYGPLVSPGCYLIVEDGVTDVIAPRVIGSYPGRGSYYAVRRYLRDGAPFEVDRRRERFGATNNPRGYLRRLSVP